MWGNEKRKQFTYFYNLYIIKRIITVTVKYKYYCLRIQLINLMIFLKSRKSF